MNSITRQFWFMRKQEVSLFGAYFKAIHTAKELKKKEKGVHKLYKHIYKNYDENLIDTLNKKLAHAEAKGNKEEEIAKYEEKLKKIAKKFIVDLDKFISSNIEIFGLLDELVEFDDRNESQNNISLKKIFEGAAKYNDTFIFTEKEITRFKRTFHRMEKRALKDIKQDYKNDKREEQGEEPRRIKHHRLHQSNRKVSNALRKAIQQFSGDEEHIKKISERLAEQLKKGVKPDFLSLLEGYVNEFALIERVIEIIRDDVRSIIVHHVREHNKIAKKTYTVAHQLKRTIEEIGIPKQTLEKIDAFENKEGEGEPIGNKAIAFAKKDEQVEKIIYGELQQIDKAEHVFLRRLEEDKIDFEKQRLKTAA